MEDGFILWPKKCEYSCILRTSQWTTSLIEIYCGKEKKYLRKKLWYSYTIVKLFRCFYYFTSQWSVRNWFTYKETNSHDHLNYISHHPEHTQQNIPSNLAKRTIVFLSDEKKINERLSKLKTWLLSCRYPLATIEKDLLMLNYKDLRLKKKR